MPLTEDQERAEHELRIEMMSAQIEQIRLNVDKTRQEIRMETRKIIIQTVAALGTAMAGGAGLLALILHWTGRL